MFSLWFLARALCLALFVLLVLTISRGSGSGYLRRGVYGTSFDRIASVLQAASSDQSWRLRHKNVQIALL